MPDTDETDSCEMLCEDWGSAYLITRAPGTARPCRAGARRPGRHPGRRQPRRAAGADPRGLPGPPRPPGGGTVTLPAGPPAVTEPAHPVHALTTSELRRYQRDLEQAIAGIAAAAPVQEDLRRKLGEVLAEQESRTQIKHARRKGARGL